MKVKKLNMTHRVCADGNAQWVAMFQTGPAFMDAIIQMHEGFGKGSPFTGYRNEDAGHPWLFRQQETGPNSLNYHALYLTSEEQITLLSLSYTETD